MTKAIMLGWICLTLSITTTLVAQERSKSLLSIQISYNGFSMKELKEIQNEFVAQLQQEGIQAKAVDQFPSFWGYELLLLIPVNKFNHGKIKLGPFFGYTSTGGRVHYQDYSGEIGVDQTLSMISLGVVIESELGKTGFFSPFVNLKLNFGYNSLKYKPFLRIGSNATSQTSQFQAYSLGMSSFMGSQIVWGRFIVRLVVGYQLDASTALKLKGVDAFLITNNRDKVHVSWSGFRLGVQLGVHIN